MSFWKETTAGRLSLMVRLTPKAADDRVDGPLAMADGSVVLAARVRAVPEKGRANDALITLLSRELGIAKSRLALASGGSARRKTITIKGAGPSVEARLAALSERR